MFDKIKCVCLQPVYNFVRRNHYQRKKRAKDLKQQPTIIVHGGAGDIPDYSVNAHIEGVKKAAEIGYQKLISLENVTDAVEAAIRSLEANETFNAGRGSYLNESGELEMDACIMSGLDFAAGNVTSIKNVEHPISLARLIMEKTPHVVLAGEGAANFAKEIGMEILSTEKLITKKARARLDDQKHGTIFGAVGAVALNDTGNIAAGTSSGGQNRKMVGTSSDIAKIGSGTYADNMTAGVAASGHALGLAKYCCAYTIVKSMEFGLHPVEAINNVLRLLDTRLQAQAGAVCISKTGDVVCVFNTKRMVWAYKKGKELHYGIESGEHKIEKI